MNRSIFNPYIVKQIYKPAVDSHKGQNGRLLVIGGSELFHAAIFWSAQVASKVVDLVHFTSPANENNDLVRQKIKAGFWEGIVTDWGEVDSYIQEDDCILIGPGMTRTEAPLTKIQETKNIQIINHQDSNIEQSSTRTIVNYLLSKYPDKRWVVDGGALQEVEPSLLNGSMMITPHQGEYARLASKMADEGLQITDWNNINERAEKLSVLSKTLGGVTILAKGKEDVVCRGEETIEVTGGSAGMTKGGTGDVLAGLAAALYCKNDAFLSAQAASFVCKRAGEKLEQQVGVYFNAQDLVGEVPKVLAEWIRMGKPGQ